MSKDINGPELANILRARSDAAASHVEQVDREAYKSLLRCIDD